MIRASVLVALLAGCTQSVTISSSAIPALDFASEFTGLAAHGTTPTVQVVATLPDGFTGYYRDGVISLLPDSGTEVLVHEYVHWLQHINGLPFAEDAAEAAEYVWGRQ